MCRISAKHIPNKNNSNNVLASWKKCHLDFLLWYSHIPSMFWEATINSRRYILVICRLYIWYLVNICFGKDVQLMLISMTLFWRVTWTVSMIVGTFGVKRFSSSVMFVCLSYPLSRCSVLFVCLPMSHWVISFWWSLSFLDFSGKNLIFSLKI